MLGVAKPGDVMASAVPPVADAYQSMVSPVPALAEIFTVPVPHLDPFVPVGTEGIMLIVAVTTVLVADTQPVVVFLDSA